MGKQAIIMPSFAVATGAVGYFLRQMERRFVFDSFTGLPERGAAITYALIWSSMAFLLISALFAYRVKIGFYSLPGFENAFRTDPLAYPMSFVLIGVLWLGATVRYYFNLSAQNALAGPQYAFLALCALSAISLALFALEVYQDPRKKTKQALSVVPAMFMCFWLVYYYRQNASNPILLSYAYHCLALIASALAFYFLAGFLFGRAAPSKTILAFLAAIYFSLVTLADTQNNSIRLIFVLIIATNFIYASMLISNLQKND
ncbi:MAG: hypothetical protein FWG88_04100 [Oscillospiraceae bacterium]|nr:hypothetical protein [Oscillospiraceae bacterium]